MVLHITTRSPVFMISGTFHHHEEIFGVNANEDIENMDICDFTQDTSPTLAPLKNLPVASTILTTPLEVHSYTPLSSKQKQPPNDESNSKTIAPKSTNLTQTTATKLYTATLKRKAPPQNQKIPKLTIKLSSPPLSLSLTPPTPQQSFQQTHTSSFTVPTIFPRTIPELLRIIPQKSRKMTIRVTF